MIEDENKYLRGKIYKLVPKVWEGEFLTYYGSTCEYYLSNRLCKHKDSYKKYLEDKTFKKSTAFEIYEKHSINNVIIVLVEEYPCNNK